MSSNVSGLMAASILALGAFGQSAAEENLDQVFYFSHTNAPRDIQEIHAIVRAIADIQHSSADTLHKTLTLRGKAGQMTLAQWVFKELDRPQEIPAEKRHGASSPEYRPANGDDVTRIFYLTHLETPQQFNELAALVRALTDIRRLMIYTGAKGLVLRGTADQIAFGTWLSNELNKPMNHQTPSQRQESAFAEYRLPGGAEVARVFYLAHVGSPQNLNELAALARAVGDTRRLLTYSSLRAVALRGTTDQAALVEWLYKEVDQPTDSDAFAQRQASFPRRYRMQGDEDNEARVFFLSDTRTAEEVEKIATRVRTTVPIYRLLSYSATRAIALRGNALQVARAEQLLKELESSSAQK